MTIISLAKQKIKEANLLIKEKIPTYKEPIISYIKETKASSYWANIGNCNDGWGIHVSSLLFNKISPDKLEKRMLECMTHELLHTIPECQNHGKKFKHLCSLFYPLEVYSYREEFIEESLPKPKYLLKCSVCNYEYNYCRKPKYSAKNYVCKCGNRSLKLISI